MNVQTIARILGPILLRESETGRKALKVINEILPIYHNVKEDASGDEVTVKIEQLPDHWQEVLKNTDVEDDKNLNKLKRELKAARVKSVVKKTIPRSTFAIIATLLLVVAALIIVCAYAILATGS